ncbi:unnamed protein product [Rhodiola kirilowii]
MATPKNHIDEIRRTKFSIGGPLNPLTEDLHQAVKNLSAELYAKDSHFLMELIQNAEDNEYPEGVKPTLEFVVTDKDITETGAESTLLIFNNEKGFSSKNIKSICSVGRSTKKGKRKQGYIGEKGIGFKSVFLITSQPYIFSNGYKMRFNEKPTEECSAGYIVPEWVEHSPTVSQIHEIYGSNLCLPTTVFVLPLKHDKVKAVKEQLSNMHPKVLLFLSNIRKLSVREENKNPELNSVSAISIASETNFVTRKNIDAESCSVLLSAEQSSGAQECSYYMWKQKFPVKVQHKVDLRMEVDEWVITLAFPFDQRLDRGMGTPGVYAFLPTEMETKLPFIIQADFLLASSRETILLDNKWNKGILSCVPLAFVNALNALVKSTENAPRSSLTRSFKFLPVEKSPYKELENVRESIRENMMAESIIPCESYTAQNIFGKPQDVARLVTPFWRILHDARDQGVNLSNLSSHKKYVIHHSFDKKEFDDILNFLDVKFADNEWYAKCIQSSNLVTKASESVYLDLLKFISNYWSSFKDKSLKSIPLLKYVGSGDKTSLVSIEESNQGSYCHVMMSEDPSQISWLIECNKEFDFVGNRFFMPSNLQKALHSISKGKDTLLDWLKCDANVSYVNVYKYGDLVKSSSLNSDCKLVFAYAHFLWHSLSKKYLSRGETERLCDRQLLLDRYGQTVSNYGGVLVPAKGSKWVELIGMNPWKQAEYVQLGENYLQAYNFAGCYTGESQLLEFVRTYMGARDIPDVSPPNDAIPTVAASLTKQNALLLLDWVHSLLLRKIPLPEKFLNSIKQGSWLRITLNNSPGYKPPSQSFLLDSSSGILLQRGSVFVDIPLVDQAFYDNKLLDYKEALRNVGVMFNYGAACKYIGNHLMSVAASSSLTRANFFAILKFIKYLRGKSLSPKHFIKSINTGKWLNTVLGYKSPNESVLYSDEWKAAQEISDIAFIDMDYYGDEILCFEPELEVLGVITHFNDKYQLIEDCLKRSSALTHLTSEAVHLILKCVRNSKSQNRLLKALKNAKFLKTNLGSNTPGECILCNPAWGSFLKIFHISPLIETRVYDNILLYENELSRLGVTVSLDEAAKRFAHVFRQQATKSSIHAEHIQLLLESYRQLKTAPNKLPSELKHCLSEVKWLRTRLGDYRAPKDCILFGESWESVQRIARLPFLDEKYCGEDIHSYAKELKNLGVVIEFRDGVSFVAACLRLPSDPGVLTPENMLSLLDCVKILLQKDSSLSKDFLDKVSGKWMRTHAGYQSPNQCLLYNSKWGSPLKCTDGPFVDEHFYGSKIRAYATELGAIGAIVEVNEKGIHVIASHVLKISDFSTIVRIYTVLNEKNWKSRNSSGSADKIWIPDDCGKGHWATPSNCVLHDKCGLFDSRLYVLGKYYDSALLPFFSSAFDVKMFPSLEDCFVLWSTWETSLDSLSRNDCLAFWKSTLCYGSSIAGKFFSEKLRKLPAHSGSFDIVMLCDKEDVFLPDDLFLKELFEDSSNPIFVWCPASQKESRTSLLDFYHKIKVKLLSEHVVSEELAATNKTELKSASLSDYFIGKELVTLILSFLAQPSSKMSSQARHEAVNRLLNLKVLESAEPITTSYTLKLPTSKRTLTAKASCMIRWDKDSSTLFVQKMDNTDEPKFLLNYAIYFSTVIAKGVLWNHEELVDDLTDLLKVGFLLKFDKEAVKLMMVNKNLQSFPEDDEFFLSAFPSC